MGRFLASLEINPPQRHTAEEGHHERRDVGRGHFDPAEGRAGDQERLAQNDNDEQPAALGEVPTFDWPLAGTGASETRYVVASHRGAVGYGQSDDPQHVLRLATQQTASYPQPPAATCQVSVRWKVMLSG